MVCEPIKAGGVLRTGAGLEIGWHDVAAKGPG